MQKTIKIIDGPHKGTDVAGKGFGAGSECAKINIETKASVKYTLHSDETQEDGVFFYSIHTERSSALASFEEFNI